MDMYGDHDFKLGEGRYLRLHFYPTLEAANADLSTAVGRMIYVVATKTAYFGMPGRWYPVGGLEQSAWSGAVNTPGDLTGLAATDGEARIVVLDPMLGNRPNIFIYGGGVWRRATDVHNTSLLRTKLQITSSVAAGTALALAGAATAGTTRVGDAGNVGVDDATFQAVQEIAIYLNGTMLDKGTEVVRTSSTSITLPGLPLDTGDVVTVISYTP